MCTHVGEWDKGEFNGLGDWAADGGGDGGSDVVAAAVQGSVETLGSAVFLVDVAGGQYP